MPIQKISQVKLPNNTVYNLNVYGQYAGGKNLADSITFEGNGDSGKWPLVAYTDDRFHGGKYYMLEVKTVDSSNYIDVGLRMNKIDIQDNFIDGLTYVASFLARVEKTASSNLALRNNTTGIYISSLVKDKVFKNIEYNQDVTIDDFNNRWNIVSVTFQYDASGLSQLQDGPLTIADFRVDGEAVGDKVYVANGRIEMGNIPTTIEIEGPNAVNEYKALTSKSTTATTTVGETYGVAGVTSGNRIFTKWFVNIGKTTPADGDIITIKIPVAGVSSGVAITLDGGSNFYPVIMSVNSVFTTQYSVNSIIRLQFDSAGSTGKVYGTKAGATATASAAISGGCWRLLTNYDANTTYSSKAAADGGTDTSLVTTGEKYIWNNIIRTETVGTTTVDGLQSISIGNNIASKTDGNARGTIRIYDNTSHYHSITVGSTTLTEDVSHALPTSTGWLVSAPIAGVGTSTKPVYINSSGVATQVTSIDSSLISGFVAKTGDTMTGTLGINAQNNGVGLYVTAGTQSMVVAQALEIGTASKEGVATVDIGNGVATGNADNARGCIRMYDEGTHYHLIKPAGGATVNPTHYLPNSNGFLVTATNTSATGSASKPIYINGDGVATAVDRVAFTAQNSNWVLGRDNAKFAVTTATGYNPAMSIKTKEGSWELSVYASAGQESGWNDLIFSYVTDEKYTARTNNSQNYRITPAGLYTGYVNLEKVKVNTTSNISPNRLLFTGSDGTIQAWGNYCDGNVVIIGSADKDAYSPNNAFKLAVNGSTYINQKLSVATSTTFSDTTLFVCGKSRIWGNLHLYEKSDSSAGLYFGKLASDSGATYTSVEAFYGQINFNSPCLTVSTNTLKDVNAGRFTFYQRGFDATTLAPTSYGESYQLPTVTKDRTNSATYNIFTSKNIYTADEKTAFQTAMGVVNGHTFTYTAASELLTIA